jgi:hypothetical protein
MLIVLLDIIFNDPKPWKVYLFCGELQEISSIVSGDGRYLRLLKNGKELAMAGGILPWTM